MITSQVQAHAVRLVLLGRAGRKADRVAEVIAGQARHTGVQVDDDQGVEVVLVEEDVVGLGIVVGHAHRKLPPVDLAAEGAAEVAVAFDEGDLFRTGGRTAQRVLFHHGKEVVQAVAGVVEVRNRLDEPAGFEVLQLTQEVSKLVEYSMKLYTRQNSMLSSRGSKGSSGPMATPSFRTI